MVEISGVSKIYLKSVLLIIVKAIANQIYLNYYITLWESYKSYAKVFLFSRPSNTIQSTQTYVTSYTSTRKTTKRKDFCCDFSYGRFQTHKKQTFDMKMLKKYQIVSMIRNQKCLMVFPQEYSSDMTFQIRQVTFLNFQ